MHESWKPFLDAEFAKPYFKELSEFLHEAYATGTVFPAKQQVFRAFTSDLNATKVVILGQDPYHTPGAAHGLAFLCPARNRFLRHLLIFIKKLTPSTAATRISLVI